MFGRQPYKFCSLLSECEAINSAHWFKIPSKYQHVSLITWRFRVKSDLESKVSSVGLKIVSFPFIWKVILRYTRSIYMPEKTSIIRLQINMVLISKVRVQGIKIKMLNVLHFPVEKHVEHTYTTYSLSLTGAHEQDEAISIPAFQSAFFLKLYIF